MRRIEDIDSMVPAAIRRQSPEHSAGCWYAGYYASPDGVTELGRRLLEAKRD